MPAQECRESQKIVVTAEDRPPADQSLMELGALVAAVAHEARNPLFGLSSVLDALETRFRGTPDFRPFLDMLRSQTDRLTLLMEDLLEYGRPGCHEVSAQSVPDLLNTAARSCRRSAENGSVTVTVRAAQNLPEVIGDKRKASAILTNLIDNAIQHSPAGSTVTVEAITTTDSRGEWVECIVSDRGPGISEDDLPRIFDPFFSRRPGGTGLGLAISQKAARECGGELLVRNNCCAGASLIARFVAVAGTGANGQ